MPVEPAILSGASSIFPRRNAFLVQIESAWIARCDRFFPSTLPQKPIATVTEKSEKATWLGRTLQHAERLCSTRTGVEKLVFLKRKRRG